MGLKALTPKARRNLAKRQAARARDARIARALKYAPQPWQGVAVTWARDGVLSREEAEAWLDELEPMADELRNALQEHRERWGNVGTFYLTQAYHWAAGQIAELTAKLIANELPPQGVVDRERREQGAGAGYDTYGNNIRDGRL